MKEVEKALKSLLVSKTLYSNIFGESVGNAVFTPIENQLKYWKEKLEKNSEFDGMSDEDIVYKKALEEAEQQEAIQKEMYERLVSTGHVSADIPFKSSVDWSFLRKEDVPENDENPDIPKENDENPDIPKENDENPDNSEEQ